MRARTFGQVRADEGPLALVVGLIDILASGTGIPVETAGRRMLETLSGGQLTPEEFLERPRALIGSGQGVPRYVAQVVWRALSGGYRTVDEVVAVLRGVLDRNPPVLEPAPGASGSAGMVVPDSRVLSVQPRSTNLDAVFEVWVTAGDLRCREITVRVGESLNPTAYRAVSLFWIHASVALYNLVPISEGLYEAGPRTFFVLEPLHQVNASMVARSLQCPRPELDRMRRGRGDTTVHTVRGMVVHALLERLIGGEDLEAAYRAVLPSFLMLLASVVDDTFSDEAFEAEVMRHGGQLCGLLDSHPHMRSDPQAEVRRYSPTIGIQGRIDAVFRSADTLDVVELKTGKRMRREDHAQLYVYRLLLSDFVRRAGRVEAQEIRVSTSLVSSHDGSTMPEQSEASFFDVLDTRNRLVAFTHALGSQRVRLALPYADYDARVCRSCPSWTKARCRQDTRLFGDRPDAPETEALAYFRRFSALVRQEGWWEEEALAALLDDSRMQERVEEFRTIPRARYTGSEAGALVFGFDENPSELAPGDRVLIHRGEIASRESWHGYVRSVAADSIRVAVPLSNLEAGSFGSESDWVIDRLRTDPTSEASQTALFDFLSPVSDASQAVILGSLSPGRWPQPSPGTTSGPLNRSQQEAIARAVACPVFHLIWGPPGTGKTRVIPEIVDRTREGRRGEDVLLGAFTNTALDNMLLALLEKNPGAEFVRIGRSEASPELARRLGGRAGDCFSEDLARTIRSARALRARLDETPLVAATAHRASTHPYLRQREFGLSIVDEAGQLTEPLTLGLLVRARRFVLIGDDRQLPPVVRTTELRTSLFERLKKQCEEELPDAVTLLDIQYRMHPGIMELSNRLYYDGRLRSGVTAADRRPPDGEPLKFVPVESSSGGRSNRAEAEAVETIARQLLRTLPPGSIGVISPFRTQVALLRERLAGTGVTVDTVERYQGGEREVVIISFVRSRESGFVFDDRRLNVAITRARRQLILVAHPDLFRGTKFAGHGLGG
jgi:DNA replication ATP-dependent helicase/nuclease Dna2